MSVFWLERGVDITWIAPPGGDDDLLLKTHVEKSSCSCENARLPGGAGSRAHGSPRLSHTLRFQSLPSLRVMQ